MQTTISLQNSVFQLNENTITNYYDEVSGIISNDTIIRNQTQTIIILYIIIKYMYNYNIYNTQMVAVALGPWASHSEDRAEP